MAVDVIIDPSSGQIYWNDQAGSGTQTIAISGNATNAINVVGYSNFFSPGGGGLGTQILATFTDSATSTFTPGTNAYDLGSSSLRWNFYGTGGNFTGAISTSSTTASTSSTTGALIVSGGAGIAKTSYFGQDVVIQGTTASGSTTTGALTVSGGVGIGGSLNVTGNARINSTNGTAFNVADRVTVNTTNNFEGLNVNSNYSFAFNVQDKANNNRLTVDVQNNKTYLSGNSASHELRFYHSNQSSYTGFIANSSGTVTYTWPAGDGSNGQVLYTNGSAGLAWTTPGAAGGGGSGVQSGAQYEVAFYTATGSSVAGSSTFKNDTAAANVTITHTTASTSTTTGALVISGGVGIAGSIWSGQHIVTNTTVSSSTSTGAMLVFGGLGVSGQVNAASLQTSGNAVISGNLTFNGVGVFGNATSDTINSLARYISDILPSTDNSYDLGNNSLGWRNFRVSGVGTIASLQVTSVTAGVWGGTAISAVNGGTGQVSYTVGDILYASSTTALSKLAAGTAGSVLASGGAGAAPYWKVDATGGGGGTPAGSSSWIQYNNGGSFGATSHLAYNGNINNDFVISAPYSGATQGQVNIGLGITGFDGVTLGKFAGSASGTVIAANQASGFTGNFADFQLAGSSKFTIGFDGKITVVGVYSLPTTAGTAGSVLTSNGTGNQFYWSAPGAAGGGSGTVTSGTAGSVAYYTGTGTTVGGSPGFTYTTSGTASTINVFGGSAIGTTIFTVQATSATSVRVGIGTNLPQYELEIVGELSATNKSFVIDHPTKPGKKLRYGSLEGPENGVYVRGELKDSNIIETPDHWVGLVYPDSFTVTLTPIGRFSYLYVEKIEDYKVFIADAYMNTIHCYYTVWAERKDIPKLVTEY